MKMQVRLLICIVSVMAILTSNAYAQVFDDDGKVIIPADSVPEFGALGRRNYSKGAVRVVLRQKKAILGLRKDSISTGSGSFREQISSTDTEFNKVLSSLQVRKAENTRYGRDYDDSKTQNDTSIFARGFTLYFPAHLKVDSVVKALRKNPIFQHVNPYPMIYPDVDLNDANFNSQYDLTYIETYDNFYDGGAWDINKGNSSIGIAVKDFLFSITL